MPIAANILQSLQQDFNRLISEDIPSAKPSYAREFQQSSDQGFNAYMAASNFFENMRVREEIDKQSQIDQVGDMQDVITETLSLLSPEKDKSQYEALLAFQRDANNITTDLIRHKYSMSNQNVVRDLALRYRQEVLPILSSVSEYRTLLNDSISKLNENPNLIIDKNYIGMSMSDFMKQRENGSEVYHLFDPQTFYKQATETASNLSDRHIVSSEEKSAAGQLAKLVKVTGYDSSYDDFLQKIPGAKEAIDNIYKESGIDAGSFSQEQKDKFYAGLLSNFLNGITLKDQTKYMQDRTGDIAAKREANSIKRQNGRKPGQNQNYDINTSKIKPKPAMYTISGKITEMPKDIDRLKSGNPMSTRLIYARAQQLKKVFDSDTTGLKTSLSLAKQYLNGDISLDKCDEIAKALLSENEIDFRKAIENKSKSLDKYFKDNGLYKTFRLFGGLHNYAITHNGEFINPSVVDVVTGTQTQENLEALIQKFGLSIYDYKGDDEKKNGYVIYPNVDEIEVKTKREVPRTPQTNDEDDDNNNNTSSNVGGITGAFMNAFNKKKKAMENTASEQ